MLQQKKKKKSKKLNADSEYASVFLGKVDPNIPKQNIRKHLRNKRNIDIKLSDIKELPTVGICNAFKITVPKNKLDLAITGWSGGIKAEPYSLEKPLVFAGPTTKGNKSSKGNRNFKGKIRNQRFQNPQKKTLV